MATMQTPEGLVIGLIPEQPSAPKKAEQAEPEKKPAVKTVKKASK